MSGLKIVVPTTFTDTALPILQDDPILPTSGALMLLEPAHPANPVVGVPGNGVALPNIAFAQAKAMVPAGTAVTLGAVMVIGTTYDAAGLRERSGKGGLGFITSQASAGAITRNVTIDGGSDIKAYIAANPSHKFYVSQWLRLTRINLGAPGGSQHQHGAGAATTSSYWTFYERAIANGDTEYPTDARRTAHRAVNTVPAALGPAMHTIGLENMSLTMAATGIRFYINGNSGIVAGDYGKSGSSIFYRSYIEDLTVSGRTYATVDALDFAEFTKQVVNAGGRYYGDTFTDPATIP